MDIYVATLATESGLPALDYAFDLAAVTGGTITAVHVIGPPEPDWTDGQPTDQQPRDQQSPDPEPPDGNSSSEDASAGNSSGANSSGGVTTSSPGSGGVPTGEGAVDRDIAVVEAGLRILERSVSRGEDAGYDVRTELLFGEPVQTLREYAKATGASLLVVERPGASAADRQLVRELVDESPIPVVVVPASPTPD
jgi:nucleotide-binding universal stress UspA family protein